MASTQLGTGYGPVLTPSFSASPISRVASSASNIRAPTSRSTAAWIEATYASFVGYRSSKDKRGSPAASRSARVTAKGMKLPCRLQNPFSNRSFLWRGVGLRSPISWTAWASVT